MTTLEQIEGCGLWATLVNGRLTVGPSRRLTDEWRLWIRQHKAEIMAELKAANDDPLIVTVWTPSGIAMRTRADSPEHAEWLRRMNPKPTHPRPVLPPEIAAQSDMGGDGAHAATETAIAPELSPPARRALETLRGLFEQYAENHRQGGVTNGRVRVMAKHWREAIPGDARKAIVELEACGLVRTRDLFVEIVPPEIAEFAEKCAKNNSPNWADFDPPETYAATPEDRP